MSWMVMIAQLCEYTINYSLKGWLLLYVNYIIQRGLNKIVIKPMSKPEKKSVRLRKYHHQYVCIKWYTVCEKHYLQSTGKATELYDYVNDQGCKFSQMEVFICFHFYSRIQQIVVYEPNSLSTFVSPTN
jgi:hypothetical protein